MRIKTKKHVVTTLFLSFVATLALFCATLMPNAYRAKAELAAPTNLKVDTLGLLRWDEVSGAESYEWSYSTDGSEYSSGGTCEGTEADISAAISEAVKVAQTNSATSANLYLKVKATGGEESLLEHTFDKYINYGYSTHDITDVYAPANDGITGNFQALSGLYVNELMTFGVTLSSFYQADGTSKTDFFIGFLSGDAVENIANTANYFYRLRFEAHGWTKIYRRGTIIFNQDITTVDMVANQPSYFAVGAFDTYNVSDGSVAGETVYLRRTDVIDGKPVVVYASGITTGYIGANPNNTFVTTEDAADRPSHLPNARNHTTGNNSTATVSDTDTNRTGTIPKDTFAFYSGTDTAIKATSGKLPTSSEGVSAPSMAHYDNITGQVKWNRVETATKYEWSYVGSKDGWKETTEEYISATDVAAAIQAVKANGHIRFAVRAVNGDGKSQTEYLGLDLTAFYGEKATLKDISEINTRFKDPSHNVLIDPLRNDGVSGYSYHNTGYGENTFVENAFIFETNDNITNRIMISLHAEKWMSASGYVLSIYSNGDITISKNSTQLATTNSRFWARPNAVAFELNKKYIATYGVEPLFDKAGEKVADRVSVRISEEEADGYRKLLTIVSYDNYEYAWTGVSIPTYPTYSTVINYNLYGSDDFKATTKISCVTSDREYQITPVINGKALTSQTQTVAYGQKYDFTSALETEGYDFANAEWKYKLTSDGEEHTFYLKGYLNIDFNNDGQYVGAFYTQADLIDYSINYDIPSAVAGVTNTENPTTYTVEDEITLKAPQVPQGYVFKGWYKNLESGVYSEQAEAIKESYGDITLYARIVRGYDVYVTVDDQTPVQYSSEEGEDFTLPQASNVYGKEFVGWYIKNGDIFEAYSGELTFKPTSNMEFWAKYAYKNYTITYNAFEGQHTNPTTYTTENVLAFAPAEKENYFFDGWYETPDFSGERVTDTDGLTKDLTLYAKYVEDKVSRTVTYSLSEKMQRLPLPGLPLGATYTAKLYETGKTEELDIIEGNSYVFDKEGSYTLKYYITLSTGEELEREIVIDVKAAKITVDGSYKAEYNVGDELVVLDGYLPDGSKATVEVKKDGKTITLDGTTLVLEAGKYEIIYKDGTGILQSVAVTFEVVEGAAWYEKLIGGCKGSFGAGVGVIAAMATMAGAALLKKKED